MIAGKGTAAASDFRRAGRKGGKKEKILSSIYIASSREGNNRLRQYCGPRPARRGEPENGSSIKAEAPAHAKRKDNFRRRWPYQTDKGRRKEVLPSQFLHFGKRGEQPSRHAATRGKGQCPRVPEKERENYHFPDEGRTVSLSASE